MFELSIIEGLNELVPGAVYEGDLSDNTLEAYDSIVWLDVRPKPSWEAVYQVALNCLRRRVAERIDAKTRELIVYGFKFDEVEFYMPLEWQFDVLNLYLIKDSLQYPYLLKVNSKEDGSCVYYEIKDATHFSSLYTAVFSYIKNVLDEGRRLKDSLKDLSKDELENWLDPRGDIIFVV